MAPHFSSGKSERRHNETEMSDMTEINAATTVASVANESNVPPTTAATPPSTNPPGTLNHKDSYTSETSISSTTSSLLGDTNKDPNTQGIPNSSKIEAVETGLSATSFDGEDYPKDEHGREISPIAEVAAVVANTDDPSLPCLTFRFWVMGLVSILALSFVNQVTRKKTGRDRSR